MQPVKTYFVTGATGAIGSALIPMLLEDTGVHVKLLLRAASAVALAGRLEDLFRFWEVGAENATVRSRVGALRGDVSLPRFALNETEYRDLASSCTHIVHAAANVRMNLPIAAARKSAVDSAKAVVEFARVCPLLQKVEFVSTVGVGGRMPLVPEEWLEQPRVFHNTYEQAKAEAEEFLREQIETGALPATVHRPSMVVGDSGSGKIIHFQVFYHLCEFLSGRQTRGLLPKLTGTRLDTIPVDVVARAVQWSSTRSETIGRVLHLCSGPEKAMEIPSLSKALREIFEAHGRHLPPLRWVPPWLFRGTLPLLRSLADPGHRKALANLSLFLDYAGDRQRFACTRTAAMLAQAGVAIPAPGHYLGPVVRAYLDARKR